MFVGACWVTFLGRCRGEKVYAVAGTGGDLSSTLTRMMSLSMSTELHKGLLCFPRFWYSCVGDPGAQIALTIFLRSIFFASTPIRALADIHGNETQYRDGLLRRVLPFRVGLLGINPSSAALLALGLTPAIPFLLIKRLKKSIGPP